MGMIMAVNPTKKKPARSGKKSGTKAKKGKAMAKRKRNALGQFVKKGRSTTKKKTTTKKKRRNPVAKTKTKTITRYAKSTVAGVNVGGALRNTVPLLAGALAAKFCAKKFTDDDGSESANWTWKNYALGLLGGFAAALIASVLLKAKGTTSQRLFEGALMLVAYKIFINEIASQNDSMKEWFGGYDAGYFDNPAAMGPAQQFAGPEESFDPYAGGAISGAIIQGEEDDYVQGMDGQWRPVSESHRDVQGMSADEMLTRPTATMGAYESTERLRRPSQTMGDFEEGPGMTTGTSGTQVANMFAKAYGN